MSSYTNGGEAVIVVEDFHSEEQFLELARTGRGRPPMPWPSLQAMSEKDLKAIFAYVRSLGPAGEPAPAALSPGVAPDRPHIVFAPQMPTKG